MISYAQYLLVLEGRQKRPDATVFILDQDSYSIPVAFGEAKLPTANNILLVKDLIRIAMFSKDSIDKYNLFTSLLFQAVKNHVSFYTMQLKNDVGTTMLCRIALLCCSQFSRICVACSK